jgi:hypothetical protein
MRRNLLVALQFLTDQGTSVIKASVECFRISVTKSGVEINMGPIGEPI